MTVVHHTKSKFEVTNIVSCVFSCLCYIHRQYVRSVKNAKLITAILSPHKLSIHTTLLARVADEEMSDMKEKGFGWNVFLDSTLICLQD